MGQAGEQAKIALITGANKGLGLETARQLGELGYTVLIGARSAARGEDAAAQLSAEGADARFIELDVTDPEKIRQAAARIGEQYGKLDVLVNNAGVFADNAPTGVLDVARIRETYETNVFGLYEVTRTMLPLLRESASGRIVNISSSLGSLALNADPQSELAGYKMVAYNSSKTAVNALTILFAHELRDTPIKVNSADPGYMATDMTGNQGPRSPKQGAAIVVRLATLPEDGPTGGYFNENGALPW